MTAPVQDISVSSKFGNRVHPVTGEYKFHNGIDIPVPENTPVFSPLNGTVDKVLTNDVGGVQLIIQHDNGYRTGYAHLNERVVKPGEKVFEGQVIALSGATGAVTGAHLHFTMKDPAGNFIDPEPLVKAAKTPEYELIDADGSNKLLLVVMGIGLIIVGSYIMKHEKTH